MSIKNPKPVLSGAQRAQVEVSKTQNPKSLTTTLTTAFIVLTVISLLLVGSVQITLNFLNQQEVVVNRQQLTALDAANQVSSFIEQIYSSLETAAQVGRPLTAQPGARQLLLQNLQTLQPSFREIALLNSRGQEIAKLSDQRIVPADDLLDRANSDVLIQTNQGQRYVSSVYTTESTKEPLITVAVPLKNNFGSFQGALLAEVNLKFMQELVGSLEIGQDGVAYVVDVQGNLIAFGDNITSRNLLEEVADLEYVADFIESQTHGDYHEPEAKLSAGINGTYMLGTHIHLDKLNWAVVTELPWAEAYQETIWNIIISFIGLLVTTFVAGWVGVYFSRRLAAPLLNLTQTATRIAKGETDLKAALAGPTEVTLVADAFNSMTAQLQDLIGSLEERIAARTRRLEMVATVSEHLTAILDVGVLLRELVNRVKKEFGYYHTHVYLFDEEGINLIMVAGVGQAGAQMKAEGFSIPLDAPTSLVARAARSGEIVSIENVQEDKDWLSNPLLPNTHSEMAVPIILEGQVVGVLDVQQDEIAGLDETDANLLRSLANQVAVAIRNARLFTEVEAALESSRAVRDRYLEQSWEKAKVAARGGQYLHTRSDMTTINETQQNLFNDTQQQALQANELQVITLNNGSTETPLVSSIRVQNKTIGTLQLHTGNDYTWDDDDLAILEAVVDQLAQTADNLRLFEDTRERATQEQMIREVTEKMQAATNLEELVQTTAEALGEYFSVDYAVVELGIETN